MTREVVVDVLLAVGVGLEALACAGTVAMRDVYDRLHYLAPSSLGAIVIAAAIWVRQGPSLIGLKALVLVAILLGTSPILAHVVARAQRIYERGDWRVGDDEEIEVEES